MNIHRFLGTRGGKALFWAAALFALVMALLPHPPEVPGEPSDKVQHIVAFAVLGLLGRLAYPRVATTRLIAALSLYGAMVEIAQLIPALRRDSDPVDWLADTVACTLVLVALHWRRLRKT